MSHVSLFEDAADTWVTTDDVVLVGPGGEPRCDQFPHLVREAGGRTLTLDTPPARRASGISDTLEVHDDGRSFRIPVRDADAIASWLNELPGRITVDVSCMPNAAWASIVRASLTTGISLQACYVEPASYGKLGASVGDGLIDLSLSIAAPAPFPGFSVLRRRRNDDRCVVFLLGFEAARLSHMAGAMDVSNCRCVLIVADPGMRPDYAQLALDSNESAIDRLRSAGNEVEIRRCQAGDPFAVADLLDLTALSAPKTALEVVPLGLRTHTLGAVLFYLRRQAGEIPPPILVHDNAVRAPKGSDGVGPVHLFDLSGDRSQP